MKDLLLRIQRIILILSVVAAILLVLGAVSNPAQFYRSYLAGFLFWIEISLGCLALLMIHQLTGGSWGVPLRPLLKSGGSTLWLMAPLFLPILFGLSEIFPWARPGQVDLDPLLRHKQVYLNPNSFILRSFLYFSVWIGFYSLLSFNSTSKTHKPRNYSAAGLILYCLTSAFAAIDWIMSLEPHWYSTILGMIFFVGHGLSAMSFVLLSLMFLSRFEPISRLISPNWLNDVGNLLLVFVLLWTYLNFSQFLIIWGGNLPHEVEWYSRRLQTGWKWVAWSLAAFQFALPFFLLLFRPVKRRVQFLAWIAGITLSMRLADVYWSVIPSFREQPNFHWMDVLTPISLGSIWLGVFTWKLRREFGW